MKTHIAKPGLAACAAVALAACVATPTTTPSVTPMKPESLGLGSAPAPQIADTWWTAFGDPQLNTLVDQALAGNPTLTAALARIRMAQSELAASRAATYPQASFDPQEQRLRFSESYIIPPPYGGTTQWYGTVQANLSWSLDLFGKQQAMVDKARATAAAATLDATAARLALAGAVTQAYIALARAYILTDVAAEAVAQRQGIYDLTDTRVRAGLENNAARKIAEALLASAKVDSAKITATREIAVHQIAALMGRGADAYQIARPKLNDTALGLPETLPADLLARRADIAAALARIAAMTAGREAARAEFYPDVNLVGAAGWAAIGLTPLFGGSALQYGGGPAIHLPIFDAGEIRAHYAGATAALDQSVADYNAAVVTAVRETADALSEIRALQDQAGEQRHMREAASASVDLAEQRYKSGLYPQLNVLNAQDLLIQARRQDAALASDMVSARVSLLMALGGGFTTPPSQDNAHE